MRQKPSGFCLNPLYILKASDRMKRIGLYIHIPFCVKKCNYCDFYSVSCTTEAMTKYVNDTINTIEYWKNKLSKDTVIDTIYFGGGTPSVLGNELLLKLLNSIYKNFKVCDNTESTIEVNPKSLLKLNLNELKDNGINRISMGLQTSDDEELKILGRSHTRYDALKAIEYIKKSKINNFSLDVITGIPLQTLDSLNKTLEFCIDSNPTHISTYMLKVEENTQFYKNKDVYAFADEDTHADFYEFTSKKLTESGYRHYEISNFCRNDLISRHNTKYWLLEDYLGIGPSAHSMIDGKRFFYPRTLTEYNPENIIFESEGKTPDEYIMLSLRTDFGFDFNTYKTEFGRSLSQKFINEIKKLQKADLISPTKNGFRLTNKGFLLSNTIITILLKSESL